MLNSLHLVTPEKKEKKTNGPSKSVLNSILNYSKSLDVKTVQKQKILIHLN
jgi:hypothetical protein